MSLNISHLQLIQTLVEEHTLTRTAQRLRLTQSALSHQLRNLEESLGIEIFHRLGKRMQLTQAGERLLRTAQTVLTELQSVEEDIRKLNKSEFQINEIILGGQNKGERFTDSNNNGIYDAGEIFIDKKKNVRRIHTGFNGPATGEKYENFKREFKELILKLLAED